MRRVNCQSVPETPLAEMRGMVSVVCQSRCSLSLRKVRSHTVGRGQAREGEDGGGELHGGRTCLRCCLGLGGWMGKGEISTRSGSRHVLYILSFCTQPSHAKREWCTRNIPRNEPPGFSIYQEDMQSGLKTKVTSAHPLSTIERGCLSSALRLQYQKACMPSPRMTSFRESRTHQQ